MFTEKKKKFPSCFRHADQPVLPLSKKYCCVLNLGTHIHTYTHTQVYAHTPTDTHGVTHWSTKSADPE